MTATLVSVFFVGAAMAAIGAFAVAWRKDMTAALAGIPLVFGGAGVLFVGIARFSAAGSPHILGQELAALLSIAAVALVALGLGVAGREASR